jgi:hypothetical protein
MAEPSSPSPKILYPEWQQEYLAALLELDSAKLYAAPDRDRNRNLQTPPDD